MKLKDLTIGSKVEGENGEVFKVVSNFSDNEKVFIELMKEQ